MVGAKNILSGAATRYIPFVDKPIPGTKAAGFMAKFDQLQGQQFLEAYQSLKGGGSITEVEGEKATKAISSMQLATSETEFRKAAKDYQEVIDKGLERARKGIVVGATRSQQPQPQIPAPEGTVIRGKDGKTYQKAGGKWQAI